MSDFTLNRDEQKALSRFQLYLSENMMFLAEQSARDDGTISTKINHVACALLMRAAATNAVIACDGENRTPNMATWLAGAEQALKDAQAEMSDLNTKIVSGDGPYAAEQSEMDFTPTETNQ